MTACDLTADLLLIERIATKDAAAIAALYDRHCRLLYSLVFRILRDASEAEEVLQEVFLIAWTRVETYDRDLGSPVAWLVRIARNRAIDRLRSLRARIRALDEAPAAASADVVATPETEVLRSEQRRAVGRALEALPPDQRVLIETAYFLGLSQSELATRFELPLGTVKTRIRAGLKLLREALVEAAH
jgi:RNA polymerase sigma-70 factor, ECF subfamily